jgi:hypothetical protein
MQQNAAFMNYLSQLMHYQMGLSDVSPRLEVPKPVHYQHSGDFNNMNVRDSVVGSINTGEIERIDIALNNVRAGGENQLAAQLQKLPESVLNAKDLTDEARKETVEELSIYCRAICVAKGTAAEVTRPKDAI